MMADGSETIASAVIIPEPEPLPEQPSRVSASANSPPIHSNKRRQSSVSSQDSKRPRLDTSAATQPNGHTSPTATSATPITPIETPTSAGANERRPSRAAPSRDEERKRSKRLFGGILGALSQKPTGSAHKRREDIERKQQEKLRAQEEENEEEKKRKYDELIERRRSEQWDWDEASLKVSHKGIKARARFLKTEAEPVLYWLPFEMNDSDNKRIAEQMKVAEDFCEKERTDFEESRRKALGEREIQDEATRQQTVPGEKQQVPAEINESNDEQTTTAEDQQKEPPAPPVEPEDKGERVEPQPTKEIVDDHEEMVMEAGEGEDPVIY